MQLGGVKGQSEISQAWSGLDLSLYSFKENESDRLCRKTSVCRVCKVGGNV